jgi:hypothetical protein
VKVAAPAASRRRRHFNSLLGGCAGTAHSIPGTGLYEGDVGRHWVNNGFTVAGELDKIVGFADCDTTNLDELKYSILLTGNAYLGWDLPMCAETDPVWDLPQTPEDAKPICGHATAAVGWDPDYLFIVNLGLADARHLALRPQVPQRSPRHGVAPLDQHQGPDAGWILLGLPRRRDAALQQGGGLPYSTIRSGRPFGVGLFLCPARGHRSSRGFWHSSTTRYYLATSTKPEWSGSDLIASSSRKMWRDHGSSQRHMP